jgi:hypothetical protein
MMNSKERHLYLHQLNVLDLEVQDVTKCRSWNYVCVYSIRVHIYTLAVQGERTCECPPPPPRYRRTSNQSTKWNILI